MQKKDDKKNLQIGSLLRSVMLGVLASMIICILLLLVFSIAVANGQIGEERMILYTCVGCFIGTFIGTGIIIKRLKDGTLVVGACVGIIYCLILLIVGIVLYSRVGLTSKEITQMGAIILGAVLSGLVGTKKRKKRRKK